MGKRNYYSADKRGKELKRKRKAQEKAERKRLKKEQAEGDDEGTFAGQDDIGDTREAGAAEDGAVEAADPTA